MTPSEPPAILIVEDEVPTLEAIGRLLRLHGLDRVIQCSDSRKAIGLLKQNSVALVLLDLVMPHVSGEEVLDQALALYPDLPVIVVTGEDDVATAVRCMKRGAVDYLLKPVEGEHFMTAVESALELSALRYEAARLRDQFLARDLERPEAFAHIITSDPGMQRLFAYLEAVSRGTHPVLITGETGTGKELVAQALHAASGRSGPFVAVNVAGLDDTMFSDTLFGHRAGAFTGAADARKGMIEQAGRGTLFLDEIGDLAEPSQVKLLRLVQEREYFPLGADSPKHLEARVVAATLKDPAMLRKDLYYRLRLYHARIPPLRERLGDLPALVEHFLEAAAADLGRAKPGVPGELHAYLGNYAFPGNVRELQAMVFDAVARSSEATLRVEAFTDQIGPLEEGAAGRLAVQGEILFPFPFPSMRHIESAAIDEALRRVGNNQSAAARLLGLSRSTIARHLERRDDA